jgi:hypothetical protein
MPNWNELFEKEMTIDRHSLVESVGGNIIFY